MIPRYSRPEMTKIWNTTSRFQIWLDIEKYACEAQEKLGVIPNILSRSLFKNRGITSNLQTETAQITSSECSEASENNRK